MNIADRKHATALADAKSWLESFAVALQSQNAGAVADMFLPDGLWRDVLAFTWTIETAAGRAAIEAMLRLTLARTRPVEFHIPPRRTPPRWVSRAGIECIEAIFEFETAFGAGNGVLRLVPDKTGSLRAWTLNTNLHELRGHEEAFKNRDPEADSATRDFGAANWLDRRNKARGYDDHDQLYWWSAAGRPDCPLPRAWASSTSTR